VPGQPAGRRWDDERISAPRLEWYSGSRIVNDEPLAASWDPRPEPVPRHGAPAGRSRVGRGSKSWIGSGHYQFQRIDDSRAATLRISLTSQMTTRALCGFRIPFDASCWKPEDQRVVINTARWARGAVAFQGNVVQYQQYVVNHEVGHGLGFPHIACEAAGRLAPVMMQQTWGVADDYLAVLGTDRVNPDGLVCQPNAWPFPTVN
jgi:hypothetical protein